MNIRRALVHALLYGATTALAAADGSWITALLPGALAGVAGLAVEHRLRASFEAPTAFFATLALLSSVSLSTTGGALGLGNVPLFVASCAAFYRLATGPTRGALRLALTALLAILPSIVAFARATPRSVTPDNLLVALFGAHGLLYGAPLLWLGFVGLVALRHEKPALARLSLVAVGAGALALLLSGDPANAGSRVVTWLPFLVPGIAQAFVNLRAFAARRPERVLIGAAAALVLWNALFMEQYRRRLLPSDDTVSFAQVTSNSAALVSRFVGTPSAWPANWIFARRFHTGLDQWDAIADRRLFARADAATASIEFGDDASVFAPDVPLMLEGFGAPRTCERGWCRDLDGAGRLLLPLKDVGSGDLTIRVRVRGQGALTLSLDGGSTSVTEMTDSLADATLRVPARAIEDGTNVLSLSVTGGERATVDRLTLERVPLRGSTR